MIVDHAIMHTKSREKEIGAEYIFVLDRKLVKKVREDVSQYFSVPLSVTITALEVAFYMGFKEIYLLGLDYSFAVEIESDGNEYRNKGSKCYAWWKVGECSGIAMY